MKNSLKFFLSLSLITAILGFIGLHFIAPYAILQPPRLQDKTTPTALGISAKALKIQTEDQFQLAAYWIQTNQSPPKAILILVHGIGGCKEHFLALSKSLAEQGIASIVFDGRAHGKSEGKYCTYGFKEKRDISKIVDKIKSTYPQIPIGIWGNSLGGAIAIQALASDKRIAFGIIESTFAELDQIVFDYKKRILKGIGIRMLSDYLLKRAGEIAAFPAMDIKPILSVQQITQPVLIAHGDADKNISVKYSQQLFEQLKSTKKELAIVKGGGHFDLLGTGGKVYQDQIMHFIEKAL